MSSGPLLAARELLRNPPDPVASPEVLRQWRDNVDRLLNLAQASPGSMGGSVSRQRRRQGSTSGSVHSPSVRSAQTEDLQAELDRRRVGEDARVTMEWARECRFNIKGRNLDTELNAAAPRPRGHAQALVAGVGGYVALADHLRVVAWPSKFCPHLSKKYNGSTM